MGCWRDASIQNYVKGQTAKIMPVLNGSLLTAGGPWTSPFTQGPWRGEEEGLEFQLHSEERWQWCWRMAVLQLSPQGACGRMSLEIITLRIYSLKTCLLLLYSSTSRNSFPQTTPFLREWGMHSYSVLGKKSSLLSLLFYFTHFSWVTLFLVTAAVYNEEVWSASLRRTSPFI